MRSEQTAQIEALIQEGIGLSEIARRFGVTRAWVHHVKTRPRKPSRAEMRKRYFVDEIIREVRVMGVA